MITFAAWEGIEAKERGIELRTFKFGDYGFPDFYQVVLACDSRWLAPDPDVARRSSRDRPRLRASPRTIPRRPPPADRPEPRRLRRQPRAPPREPGVPRRAGTSATRRARRAPDARTVAGLLGFLFEQGLLAGLDGKPLTAPPDYQALFTNEFLP